MKLGEFFVLFSFMALSGIPFAEIAAAEDGKAYAYQMIDASAGGNEDKVLELKSRIELLAKPAKGDRKAARSLNDVALKKLSSGDPMAALADLQSAVQIDPSDVEVANNLGYALLKTGQYQKAQEVLIDAIVLSPGRASAWFNLAQSFGAWGDKRARATFDIAYTFSQNKDKTREALKKIIDDPSSSQDLSNAARMALDDEGVRKATSAPSASAAVQAPAPVARESVAKGRASLYGQWDCVTQNPNGTRTQEIWLIVSDGSITIVSGGVPLAGTHQMSADQKTFSVALKAMSLRVEVKELTTSQLAMVSVSNNGKQRSSVCVRTK